MNDDFEAQSFEAQEFKRTASRLIEMRSDAYLALPAAGATRPRAGWSRDRGDVVWNTETTKRVFRPQRDITAMA